MWKSFFSFRGGIDRRTYAFRMAAAFAGLLLTGVLVFAPAYWALVTIDQAGRIDHRLFQALSAVAVPVTVTLLLPAYSWSTTALTTQRVRNAGFSPIAIVPAMLAIGPVDRLMLQPAIDARLGWPLTGMTPVGGALSVLALIVLFVLPPKAPADLAARRPPNPVALSRSTFGLRRPS